MEFERKEKKPYLEVNIETISTRKSAMKVLIFLNKVGKFCYTTEIADEMGMNWFTTQANLYKLNDAGLIEIITSEVDKRLRLWKITDKEAVENAIKRYHRIVGFRLARLVPYKWIWAEQLKRDQRYIKACQDYGLTLDEGFQAVRQCTKKIDSLPYSGSIVVCRKSQGYDSPEKEIEVEEVY